MDLKSFGDRLLAAGAPSSKSVVENSIGGLGGSSPAPPSMRWRALHPTPPPKPLPSASSAGRAAEAIRQVEQVFRDDLARIAEAQRDVMVGYQAVLQQDAQSEGWLAQRWRPIFAIAFTFCFVMIAVTVCRGIWIGQLQGVEAVTGLLITMLAAGCAVLGVQIWQRSEEKKAGVI